MKNLSLLVTFLLTFVAAISLPAMAHSGHDHSAADAGLIHLLWLAPIIIAAGVLAFKELTSSKRDN